jgi:hypothetical protein
MPAEYPKILDRVESRKNLRQKNHYVNRSKLWLIPTEINIAFFHERTLSAAVFSRSHQVLRSHSSA